MSVLSAGAPSATLECARALTAMLEHDVENIAELMTMLITELMTMLIAKVSRMFGYHKRLFRVPSTNDMKK